MAEENLTPNIGGKIEEKEIGLSIGTKGKNENIHFEEATGAISLALKSEDGSGRKVYETEGRWTSEVINLGDKFRSFHKVFTNATETDGSSHKIYTRSSSDNNTWTEWKEIIEDGTIQSPMNQFFQVKIELKAGMSIVENLISDFNSAADAKMFTDSELISTENGLKLSNVIKYDMTPDTSWTEEGSLHRKKITRDEWLRIDKMNVLIK